MFPLCAFDPFILFHEPSAFHLQSIYLSSYKYLSDERLQAGLSEGLAEQEELCLRVVLGQSPRSQPEDILCRFLLVGSSEKSGDVWRHSECERGDLGVGGEGLERRRSEDIDRGCPSEQYG